MLDEEVTPPKLTYPLHRILSPLPATDCPVLQPTIIKHFNINTASGYASLQGRRNFAGMVSIRNKYLTPEQTRLFDQKQTLEFMNSLDWTFIWVIQNSRGPEYIHDYILVRPSGIAYRLNMQNCLYLSRRFPVIETQCFSFSKNPVSVDYPLVCSYRNRITYVDPLDNKTKTTSIICDHVYYKQTHMNKVDPVTLLTPRTQNFLRETQQQQTKKSPGDFEEKALVVVKQTQKSAVPLCPLLLQLRPAAQVLDGWVQYLAGFVRLHLQLTCCP